MRSCILPLPTAPHPSSGMHMKYMFLGESDDFFLRRCFDRPAKLKEISQGLIIEDFSKLYQQMKKGNSMKDRPPEELSWVLTFLT